MLYTGDHGFPDNVRNILNDSFIAALQGRFLNDDGFFIAPAPMYESYKGVLHNAIENHRKETLIRYKDQFNRGFETPIKIEYEEKNTRFE